MRLLLSLLFCTCSYAGVAQAIVINNSARNAMIGGLSGQAGYPVDNNVLVDIKEGSFYFDDRWQKSTLVTQDGQAYANIQVRVNLLSYQVHYLDTSGKELLVGASLKVVEMEHSSAAKSLYFINGSMLPVPRQGWHLLLVNDSLSLVKGFHKKLEEHLSYSSGPEYSIKTTETYLVFFNKKEYEVRKPSDFARILPQKKKAILQKIKELDRALTRDEQLSIIAAYCNTLLVVKPYFG